jgi:TorA maturation chaperone TorD
MNYQINSLNSNDFELLSQAICKQIIGPGSVSFGDGPDGGREATYQGSAPFPSETENWAGYWVFQAKFRKIRSEAESKDFDWLRKEVYKELNKYDNRKTSVIRPENLIFFTNIILTPVAKTGGLDLAEQLCRQIESKYNIQNVKIISHSDIVAYLNSYRDIAISFAPFILPGDILFKLYNWIDKEEQSSRQINALLGRYLEVEFKQNLYPKLEHAGKVTSEKINLEKVFIDLYTTDDNFYTDDSHQKFVAQTIDLGNSKLSHQEKRTSRFVLIAGPGYGKSTLTQFLCQVYRAFFLKNLDSEQDVIPEVMEFWNDYEKTISSTPNSFRFPFRITLKEYASWLKEKQARDESSGIVPYICGLINKKVSQNFFTIQMIEELLSLLPWLIVFDGLDEVPNSSNRQEVIQEINEFTEVVLRRLKTDSLIVGTSRPQGYSHEFTQTSYTHLTISDLNEQDCLDYLQRLLRNIEEVPEKRTECIRILKNALADQIVNRLMKTPLQASIMAILVRTGGEPPRNKYALFSEYYSTIFRREKQKNIAQILNDNQDYIDSIHNKLGFGLQVLSESPDNPSATISLGEFKKFVKEYLEQDIGGLSCEEVENICQQVIEASTERLVFIEEIQEDKVGFNIRSVQEFFAANYYLKNRPDQEIQDRLRRICRSSYWTNTLLFSIGYLFREREYTIPFVDSICSELNGTSNKYSETSLTSISKQGSWLAIEILNENIFRPRPLIENRFCRYLRELLQLPFISSHNKVSKLSKNIITNWVLKFIEEELRKENSQFIETCFVLLADLSTTTTFDFKLFYSFSLSSKDSFALLPLMGRFGKINTPFGIYFLLEEVKKHSPFQFANFLSVLDESTLMEICSNGDMSLRSALLASMYFEVFTTYNRVSDKTVKVMEKLGVDAGVDIDRIEYLFNYKNDELNFRISTDLEGVVGSLFKRDHEVDNEISKFFAFYNLEVFEALHLFLSSPSAITLRHYITEFLKIPGDNKKTFRFIHRSNWLLQEVFLSELSVLEIENDLYIFGDTLDWVQSESDIENGIFAEQKTLFSFSSLRYLSNGLACFKSYYEEFFVGKEPSTLNCQLLVRILSLAIRQEQYDTKQFFEQNPQVINSLIDILYNTALWELDTMLMFNILFVIPDGLILQHEMQIDLIIKTHQHQRKYLGINSDRQASFFYRILNIYPAVSAINPQNSILRLLPAMLNGSDSIFQYMDFMEETLLNSISKYENPEDLFAIICLLVLKVPNSPKAAATIVEILEKITLTEDKRILFYAILEKLNANRNIERILLKLNEVTPITNRSHSILVTVIKNYIESQKSNIEFQFAS